MELTGSEFVERVEFYGKSWWPARTLVEKAIQERKQVSTTALDCPVIKCKLSVINIQCINIQIQCSF